MIFRLSINSSGKKISFKSGSALVKFLIDTPKIKDDLKSFETDYNLRFSQFQQKNILDKKTTEVVHYREGGNPDLVFITKIKVDENFNSDYFRNYFAGLIQKLEKENLKFLHIQLPDFQHFSE